MKAAQTPPALGLSSWVSQVGTQTVTARCPSSRASLLRPLQPQGQMVTSLAENETGEPSPPPESRRKGEAEDRRSVLRGLLLATATLAPKVWRWSPSPSEQMFLSLWRFVTYVRDSWWTAPATRICSRTNLVGAAEERKGPGRGRINTCAVCTHSCDCVAYGVRNRGTQFS